MPAERWRYRSFVQFRVLGPLEASKRDRPLPLGGPKQRTLLAHLLLRANKVVPVDTLIEDLWGSEAPPAARNALQAYVSRLRKLLGGDLIQGTSPGYVLRADPQDVDALRFEALVSEARGLLPLDPEAAVEALDDALSLWRGQPLSDLADEPSLRLEIEHLEELRLRALEDRAEALLALGRAADVVEELEGLAGRHPLREGLWARLMLALYRSGRQAEALAAYQRARTVLVDELGIEPSPPLQSLHERILRQDPALEFSERPLRGYELGEQIGEGSFGVVYRASQPQVGREVAVKVIHPRFANHPEFIRRFEAEAQLVARLEHPHIVPLYDYWREPGGAYLVMRLLGGGSLKDAVARGPLDSEAAVRLTNQVAVALATAHRMGVIHRDVKPANILFDDDGNVYLSDFGVAAYLSATGEAAPGSPGTLAYYVSPEELRREPLTPRADIYSLGMVLYEALTARHPFGDASPTVVVEKHLREPIPSLEETRPDLPARVDEVLRRATDKDPHNRFEDALALASAFSGVLMPTLSPAFGARGQVARNPYKGLRPFLEADAGDFFGREALVEQLVARMSERGVGSRFLAVVGPSGSGKSSVVRAGLVPALRRGAVPGSESWFVARMLPGVHPFEELESALLGIAARAPAGLLEDLGGDERDLVRVTESVLPRDRSELLLVIDQFEEVFTLVSDEEARRSFLANLLRAVTAPESRVRVLVTLRADHFDRPLLHKEFGDLLGSRTVTVSPPSAEELERAISRPAEGVGVSVDSELVARIVADVRGQPGALPLFQYALSEVFERRRDSRLAADSYDEIGGVSGALANRAEELYRSLDEEGRAAVRQLFLNLVAPRDGSQDTRRRSRAELASLDLDRSAMEAAIEAFGASRLLSFDRDPATRAPTVEVAHEALLGAWSRLREWIEEAREDVGTRARLSATAGEWLESGEDPGFLLRGSRLDRFESWAAGTRIALTDGERRYLRASRAQREEEEAKEEARTARERALERRSLVRLRVLVAMLSVAALVAAGLTVFAFRQRGQAQRQGDLAAEQGARAEAQARIATARELAAAAVANLDVDPERSILLALESVETTRDVDGTVLRESEEALHRAVQASRVVLTLPQGGGVEYSPDGSRLGTTGEDGTARIWAAGSGQELLTLEAHAGAVMNLVFSADGSTVATTGEDGMVRLWDAESGDELAAFSGGNLISPAFSPDGSLLAASDLDGTVWVWNTSSGEELFALRETSPVGLDFSPDGTRLAVASLDEQAAVIWDISSGRRLIELTGHSGGVVDVVFSPDGTFVATASDDLTGKIWDASSGEELGTLAGHSGFLFGIDVSDDGTLIATGSEDGTAKVWDAGTGRELLTLAGHASGISNVGFSPDGSRLATGSGDGTTKVWDITAEGSRELLTVAHGGDLVFEAAFGPDGARLATASWNGTVKVWDVPSGEELLTLAGHVDRVFKVAYSPDGTRLATASQDGTARVWDSEAGQELLTLDADLGDLPGLAYSPEGSHVVTGARDGAVLVWDASTGRQVLRLEGHADQVKDIAFSPDGDRLATVSHDRTLRLWDPESGEGLLTIQASALPLNSVAFSPDGRWLATSGFDPRIAVWDAESGEQVMTLTGHSGIVWAVSFSPVGDRLASTGFDRTVRLWDLEAGEEVLRLSEDLPLAGVAFGPDGRYLASAGDGGLARVYVLDVDELMSLARDRVSRDLSDEECRQYLHLEACPTS